MIAEPPKLTRADSHPRNKRLIAFSKRVEFRLKAVKNTQFLIVFHHVPKQRGNARNSERADKNVSVIYSRRKYKNDKYSDVDKCGSYIALQQNRNEVCKKVYQNKKNILGFVQIFAEF